MRAAVRADVSRRNYSLTYVEVVQEGFDDVCHEAVGEGMSTTEQSAFVAGLAELQARRTAGGAGLMEFLAHNLTQFETSVADEIMALTQEVLNEQKG